MKTQNWLWVSIGLTVLALILIGALIGIACNASSKPIVVLNAPVTGSQFNEGQAIVVQSTATDSKGIVKVVLSVDNLVIQEDKIDPPQTAIQRSQTWNAAGVGQHTITVRAFRADGTANDPVSITVTIVPPSAPTPTATATPAPPPPGCVNASALVSDNITVPDGTVMPAGQTFNKVWRVLNTGTCPWDTGSIDFCQRRSDDHSKHGRDSVHARRRDVRFERRDDRARIAGTARRTMAHTRRGRTNIWRVARCANQRPQSATYAGLHRRAEHHCIHRVSAFGSATHRHHIELGRDECERDAH